MTNPRSVWCCISCCTHIKKNTRREESAARTFGFPRMEIEFHFAVVMFLFIDGQRKAERSATFDCFIWIQKIYSITVGRISVCASVDFFAVRTLQTWGQIFLKALTFMQRSQKMLENKKIFKGCTNIFRAPVGERLQRAWSSSTCQGNSGQGGVIINVYLYWNSG